jgi:hypothetical protein
MYMTWMLATLAIAGYGLANAAWQLMLACLVFNALEQRSSGRRSSSATFQDRS